MEKIEIVLYHPEWPRQFEQMRQLLAKALDGLYLSIDHIGSTAVPHLRAKPRIDIQVTVQDLGEELKKHLDRRLIALGFAASHAGRDHRPPFDTHADSEWSKYFIAGLHPQLSFQANIHVRQHGLRNWRYPILFRDYLREHPATAEAYARAKEKLALYLGDNRDAYSDAKDPICDVIMVEAEHWAQRTQWQPQLQDFR